MTTILHETVGICLRSFLFFTTVTTKVRVPSLWNLYTDRSHLNTKFTRNRIASLSYVIPFVMGLAGMKIYYFCPETGIYQGEGFGDGPGVFNAVAGITTVSPPSYGRGEVPRYDMTTQRWTLISLSGWTGTGTNDFSS